MLHMNTHPPLLAILLACPLAMADETPLAKTNEAPPAQTIIGDETGKPGKIYPPFAAQHKGCPMHAGEEKHEHPNEKPCPYHADHHGKPGEHCDHKHRE